MYPDLPDGCEVPLHVAELLAQRDWSRIVAYCGAGLSAASGIPTFRGAGGYYQGHNAAQLASPEGFAHDPVLVWNWYAMRIRTIRQSLPNPGHRSLAQLDCLTITSNVDDLLDRAGVAPIRMHGNILEMRGLRSGRVEPIDDTVWPSQFDQETLPRLRDGEPTRPNVVWFGEMPWPQAFEAIGLLDGSELFLEIGTSGVVAYGFTEHALRLGCRVLRMNIDEPGGRGIVHWTGPTETTLPQLVQAVFR